jgi:hypothetical protein
MSCYAIFLLKTSALLFVEDESHDRGITFWTILIRCFLHKTS